MTEARMKPVPVKKEGDCRQLTLIGSSSSCCKGLDTKRGTHITMIIGRVYVLAMTDCKIPWEISCARMGSSDIVSGAEACAASPNEWRVLLNSLEYITRTNLHCYTATLICMSRDIQFQCLASYANTIVFTLVFMDNRRTVYV